MAHGPQVNKDTSGCRSRQKIYIMEVPPCHARGLRFCAIDEEDSWKNLNEGLPGNNVHFRENILAALVIMKWSGINPEAGRPLCLPSLKMQTGCQCLLIPVLGSTARPLRPCLTRTSEQAAVILKCSAPLMSRVWNWSGSQELSTWGT